MKEQNMIKCMSELFQINWKVILQQTLESFVQVKKCKTKLIFPEQATALECLKQKKKLQGSNISITAGLTPLQRAQLKEMYAELEHRKENGETDLIISYQRGHPQICKKTNRVDNKHNNTVSKNY